MKELLTRKCDAIKTLAQYLGGDYNVEVIYDPLGRCLTDGNRILMPIMSDETYEQYEDFLVGITFHETGHIAYSDFEVYENTKDPIQHSFLNALDDYRVESFREEDFKSGRYEILGLHKIIAEKNKRQFEIPEFMDRLVTDPGQILWGVAAIAFLKLKGMNYDSFPQKLIDIANQTDDILEEFKENVIRDRVKGTAKAKEYAIKLEKRLEEILTKPPPPDSSKEKLPGKGKGDGESIINEMRKGIPKSIFEGIKNELQHLIIHSEKKNISTHIPHPMAAKGDSEETLPFKNDEATQRDYTIIKERVQNEIDSMKSRLLSVLLAKKRMHYVPDSDYGEIDVASLYTLRDGNERIFEKLSVGKKLNTAIEILVDCSGSMSGSQKIEGAREAAVACSETLELLRIPFEVTGFTTRDKDYYNFTEQDYQTYNRFESLRHLIFKGFNENYATVKHRILKMVHMSNNGDPESVWWAACRLSKRKEQRKILIVMSDGRPALGLSCDIELLEEELKKVVRKITRAGIEVYGIGIYTDIPKKFYPEYSVISKTEKNIATAVFECLSKKLLNGGTHEL